MVEIALYLNCLIAGPGCRKDAIIAPSPRLINTLYDYLRSRKPDFMQKGDADQLLLLSHSLGGSVGFEALAGQPMTPASCICVQRYRHCHVKCIPAKACNACDSSQISLGFR